MQVEKTVFISYRRTNAMTARAVYQHLSAHGYDCFLDFESIDAGSFERIILNQIAAKAHFVVILTPSALERCAEPNDWLRREIEYALDNERNIVPLMFDGFRYSDVQKYLTGKLDLLPQYNALEVPSAYFDEAMTRLQNRFLSKPLDVILRPTPNADKQAVAEAKTKIEQMPTVTEESLSAEEWFERGMKRSVEDFNGKIADYSEAIRLNPRYADAYNNRGITRDNKQDYEGAIADYSEAIRLNPLNANAYNNRGITYQNKREYNRAIADHSEAIRLNPQISEAYNNRGNTHLAKGDINQAIADYSEAIRLNPLNANAYNNRGIAYKNKKDVMYAMADYNEAIRLNPRFAEAFSNRATLGLDIGDVAHAMADYNEAIRLNPRFANAYYGRGNARYRMKDIAGAIADYNEAIRLNPQFVDAFNNRGAVFFNNKKDYDRAIADYKAVLRIDPTNALAQDNLEIARHQQSKSKPKKWF